MHELDQFLLFTTPFTTLNVRHMVTGSVATILYGEPRLTHDIDIVIAIQQLNFDALVAAFPAEIFYCPLKEVLMVESRRGARGHFNLIHHDTGFKVEWYPS